MKINAGEIRVGMLLEYKNDLWQVLKTQHVKPGKGGAFAQVEMKSLEKNTKLNERFRSSETVEKASLEETVFNYLYNDETNYFFMNPKTFEQIEIRIGMLLEYKNDLWQVLKTQHVKPGKGGAFAQVEMKSVEKNTKLNERFRSSETVEKASLEETIFNYLYEDENNYFFMNPKTFEQIELKKGIVGEKGKLLSENLEVTISFYNENAITVDLPNQIKCKIETTDAAIKGQTVSSSYKPAKLDNGLNIQVPPFVEAGDEVIVDTRNLEYIKKI